MRCDFKDHENQYISAICTRKECDQQSANCQQFISSSHISCEDHLIFIEVLPTELEKFKSQYSQFNETFSSFCLLLQDCEFNGDHNMVNLNKLGQFLRAFSLMELSSAITDSELIKQTIEMYLNPSNQKNISQQVFVLAEEWGKKGIQHSQNHEFYKAIQCQGRALSINPLSDSFWNNKGLALIQIEKYVENYSALVKHYKLTTVQNI